MPSMIVKLKQSPEVKRLILAADSSYKKHDAYIIQATSVKLNDTYWASGSRGTYTAVDMITGRSQGAPQYNPPQFGGKTPSVEIPENVAIVKTGIFCGKTSVAFVYVREANMTKLLEVK